MPYLLQDPNEEQAGGSSSGASTPASGSGGSAGGSYAGTDAGQGSTTTSGASPTPQGGGTPGGYTNLLSYLGANQGAGSTTGRAAANFVTQSGDDAAAKTNDYRTSAEQQVQDATSPLQVDQGVLGKIQSGVPSTDPAVMAQIAAGGGKGNVTGVYSGPNAPDTSYKGPDASAYQVSYGGPSSYSNLTGKAASDQAAAEGAVAQTSDYAKAAQGGQDQVAGLLRNVYTQPNYTTGEQGLDAFLAGGTDGGKQALNSTQQTADAATGGYGKINDILTGQIANAKGQADVTNKTYSDAVAKAQADSAAVGGQYNTAINNAKAQAAANKFTRQNTFSGGALVSASPSQAAAPVGVTGVGSGINSIFGKVGSGAGDLVTGVTGNTAAGNFANQGVTNSLQQTAKDTQNPLASARQTVTNPLGSVSRWAAAGGRVTADENDGPYSALFKKVGR